MKGDKALSNYYYGVRDALNKIAAGKQILRKLNVIRSERFVGELGEWFVCEIYGALRPNLKCKYWNLMLGMHRIQVKAHGNGDCDIFRHTMFEKYTEDDFDELIIVIFTKEFKLQELYKLPAKEAISKAAGKKLPAIAWNDISDYKIRLQDLPNQDLVKLFCT